MTIHFGSSEDIDFLLTGVTAPDTTAGKFDPNFSRGMFRCRDGPQGHLFAILDSGLSTFYCTYRFSQAFPNNVDKDFIHVLITDGSTFVARIFVFNGVWRLDTRDGGGWVTRVSSLTSVPGNNVLTKITIKLVLHATTGEFTVWVGDTEVGSFIGDTIGDTGATTVDKIRFTSSDSDGANATFISEVVIADEQTINMRVATLVPEGDGNQVDWVNGFAAVDELINSASDSIQSASANEVELMTLTDYAGSTDMVVRTVFVSAKAIRGASGPQNLQLAVREGATDGFSANKALTEVYTTFKNSFTVNPDTGPAAWTLPELDTMEAGVKSIT